MGENMLDYLAAHAEAAPESVAFTVLRNGEEPSEQTTFAELWRTVQHLAAAVRRQDMVGRTALLVYQEPLPFVKAFLACQLAGVIPVPVPFARGKRQMARLLAIVQNAQAAAVCCCEDAVEAIRQGLGETVPEALQMLATDQPPSDIPLPFMPMPAPDDIAFIQYTSGSTGEPKGVVITHRNLIFNQRLLQHTFGGRRDSVILSWLPFHHDMGLVGNILHTIYLGCTAILMAPAHFIQRPARWLEGISKFKVTHSGAPDFAYRLCTECIGKEQASSLDLSSWKVAFNGSEPVRYSTLNDFARLFKTAGFSRRAFYPCYGLAEATLLVSGVPPASSPLAIRLSTAPSDDGKVLLAKRTDPHAKWLVSAGKVAPGLDVMILKDNGEQGTPMEEGEICIAGPSVTGNYFNSGGTELFYEYKGRQWLRTGDLGFFHKNALFIHGRIKEMLIIRGRNVYPYDVEEMIAECHDALAAGCAVVFALRDTGDEVIVIVEVKRSHLRNADYPGIIDAVDRVVTGEFGIRAHDIIVTPPGAIPRTTSGKRQRSLCRTLYSSGSFAVLASKCKLPADPVLPEEKEQLLDDIRQQGKSSSIRSYIHHLVQVKSGQSFLATIPDTMELTAIGLDSLRAMEVINSICKDLRIYIDPATLSESGTFGGLCTTVENIYWLKNGQCAGNTIIV